MVMAYEPPLPTAGVPINLPPDKLTPVGNLPDSVNVAVGLAVKTKLELVPTVKVAVVALVVACATVRAKLGKLIVPVPLVAVRFSVKGPVTVGVPLRVAVPLPLSWMLRPAGRPA